MKLESVGMAGTMESSDISVAIEPKSTEGIEIILKSPVENQFGMQIRKVIEDTLKELGIFSATVRANDKGALDCTIKARVQTAAYRAAGSREYKWGEDVR